MCEVYPVVEDRPDDAVCILQVIAVMFLLGEVGDDKFDAFISEHFRLCGDFVGDIAGPADPHAAGGFKRFPDSNGEPACARARISCGPVRDRNESAHAGSFSPSTVSMCRVPACSQPQRPN